MLKCLIVFILILPLSAFGSLPKKTYNRNQIASTQDKTSALHLQKLLNRLEDNSISRSTVKKLHRRLKKSRAFSHLLPLTVKAKQITGIGNSLNKFYRACSLPKSYKTTYIFKTLHKSLQSYCSSLFIKLLLKQKSLSKLRKRERLYIQNNLAHYLSSSVNKVTLLVSTFKKRHSRLYKQLSELISQEYISSGKIPNPEITSIINISDDFLLYLEQIGINDLETQKYLTNEFKRIKYTLKKSLHHNDYEAAKTLSSHLLSFHSQNHQYLPISTSWKTFLNTGKKLITSNNFAEGMQSLHYASKIAPVHHRDTIVFFILWGNLIEKKYKDGMNVINKFNLIERFSHLDSRLKYWVCHTLLKVNEDHLAQHFMRKITSENPMDFYSIVALRELSQLYAVKPETTFLKNIRTPASIMIPLYKQFHTNYQNALRRLDAWLQVGSHKYSQQEISYIFSSNTNNFLPRKYKRNEHCNSDCIIARHLAIYLTREGEYLHAFRLINKTLIDNSIDWNIITQLFPTKYRKSIQKITADLDSSLVLALIRQESAFNPKATSGVGAKGLMQLMPTTAKQLKKSVKTSQLTNPSLNIKLGIQYLTYLAKKYDGNLIYTLAAYNAGPSRIRYWMEHVFSTNNPLLTIESIPFRETRQYVKLIYRNIFFYKFLNNEVDLSVPVRDSFKIKLSSNI